MTMTSNVFHGTDTYGKNIQVAVRDGKWYYRVYGFNGYGNGWLKWKHLSGEVPEVYVNQWGKECIKWGWNEFVGGINNRLRISENNISK